MKRKVQMDYILREVYRKGTISKNELKTYCVTRNITQGQEEFDELIKRMTHKKYIGIDHSTDEVFFKKSNIVESFAIGICYFGTQNIIFYQYVS